MPWKGPHVEFLTTAILLSQIGLLMNLDYVDELQSHAGFDWQATNVNEENAGAAALFFISFCRGGQF